MKENKSFKFKKNFLYIIVIAMLILIDQLIKLYVLKNIYNTTGVAILNGILNITYVENTGGAFGLGSNSILFFIIVNAIIIGIMFGLMVTKKETYITIPASLIIAGGIGNLIDRIIRGFVIDYIDISPLIKYPVFNFADICIVIGVIILGINLIIHKDRL